MGVSGFSYPGWKGTFYPKETKNEEFLSYYSQHLSSVEINSSFYALPKESAVKGWSERTDDNFRFAFKAPQLITHVMKLEKGAPEAALRFSTTLELLGPRRGPVLFQLPPYMKSDQERLSDFLGKTSRVPGRVFEFRHPSWFEESTFRLLEERGVGFCIAETEDMKPVFRVTGGMGYFRLRKDRYDSESIEGWASKVRGMTNGVHETYVFLRHDETGENGLLAQMFSERIRP